MVASSDRLIVLVMMRAVRACLFVTVPYQRRLKMLWLTSSRNIAVPMISWSRFPSQ